MGPVTIAVDSYGPVTDNAQSVYELSMIETLPKAAARTSNNALALSPTSKKARPTWKKNDGAGNTFKATAKSECHRHQVVGATTMIFSTIVALTNHLTTNLDKLPCCTPPFLLGLVKSGRGGLGLLVHRRFDAGCHRGRVSGGGVHQAAHQTGWCRKSVRGRLQESRRHLYAIRPEGHDQHLPDGILRDAGVCIYWTVLLCTGYLVSIAVVGLYQAIFMANAGGAWDNAKKIVETELKAKGTPLHDATVVGDTVGDPFKDTSSVALNPIIKFTTLFGLLAVELAVAASAEKNANGEMICHVLAAVCLLIALFFIYRSFYGMRIGGKTP